MKSRFLDKLIDRLDKLDPESLQTHFLKLVQERGLLETIFQSIQEGVIAIDQDGKIQYANRAAEHLLGFSLESVYNRPASRYLREIDWDLILKLDENEWSRLISREIEVTYPQYRVLNFYLVPLMPTGEGSEDSGAVLILRDVTQDRIQEASLLESERLNAVKLLAMGVAHEIGNPLNALNIHLQLLARELRDGSGNDPAALTSLVETARQEVSRLDLIMTQFLRAIRPAHPTLKLTRIEDVLEETISLMKQEVTDRNIEIELDLSSNVPPVPLDRNQIKQAVFNIVRNAFQAMPNGGVLKLAVKASDRYVTVTFEDSGVGIAHEDLGRIFEPYHTTKQEGSGLGLMIVQRIIQDHGGQIDVESKPEAGTRFRFSLPLAERRPRLLRSAVDPDAAAFTDVMIEAEDAQHGSK